MHSIIKSSFYLLFLGFSLYSGVRILLGSNNRIWKLLGVALLVLGGGEAFHIVPRVLEISSGGVGIYAEYIKYGRFVSSVVILVFYVLLDKVGSSYYQKNENLNFFLIGILVIGVVLNILLRNETTLLPSMLRNLPLFVLVIYVTLRLRVSFFSNPDKGLRFMWLALLLSVVFTVAFELLSYEYEFLIILLMPKTLMQIWFVFIVYKEFNISIARRV